MTQPSQLTGAIATLSAALAEDRQETALRRAATVALSGLLRDIGWLAPALRTVDSARYRRELLHEASDGAFSIGCFVWDRGQRTPIHDHTCWGLVGVAEGALLEETFTLAEDRLVAGPAKVIARGHCSWCRPGRGDIHRVGAAGGLPALSLHIYGNAFDRICRTVWEEDTISPPPFPSYADAASRNSHRSPLYRR